MGAAPSAPSAPAAPAATQPSSNAVPRGQSAAASSSSSISPTDVDPTLPPQLLSRLSESAAVPHPLTALRETETAFTPALMDPTRAGQTQVFIKGQPRTNAEAHELKQVHERRAECIHHDMWSPIGFKWTAIMTAVGLPYTVFAPRKWPLLGRWWVPVVMLVQGVTMDNAEVPRRCAEKHPLPGWVIERAIPIEMALAQKREMEAATLRQKESTVKIGPSDMADIAREMEQAAAKRAAATAAADNRR